jgi:hypothetical protein
MALKGPDQTRYTGGHNARFTQQSPACTAAALKGTCQRHGCADCCAQALHDECLRGAKFVSRLLEALGAEVKMAQPYDGKNPVVLGRLGNNPNHPTGQSPHVGSWLLFADHAPTQVRL